MSLVWLRTHRQALHQRFERMFVLYGKSDSLPGCMCACVVFAPVRVRVRAQTSGTSAVDTPLLSVSALDIPVPEAED